MEDGEKKKRKTKRKKGGMPKNSSAKTVTLVPGAGREESDFRRRREKVGSKFS